jgi:hypothetical protein
VDGAPTIVDFGLAWTERRDFERLTREGDCIGTPDFMSPEQAWGEKTGPASDVWALGIVLFQAVTGKLPFHGSNHHATLQAIATRPAPIPSRIESSVPRALDAIILRCLERKAAVRYPTAIELAIDLEAFLAGEPPSAEARFLAARRALLVRRLVIILIAAIGFAALAFGARRIFGESDAEIRQREAAEAELIKAAWADATFFDPAARSLGELVPVAARLHDLHAPARERALEARLDEIRPLARLALLPSVSEANEAWDRLPEKERTSVAALLLGAEIAANAGDPRRAMDRLARAKELDADERAQAKRWALEQRVGGPAAELEPTIEARAAAALALLDRGVPSATLTAPLFQAIEFKEQDLELAARRLLGEIALDASRSREPVAPLRKELERTRDWCAKLNLQLAEDRVVVALHAQEVDPGATSSHELALFYGNERQIHLAEAQLLALKGAQDRALALYDEVMKLSLEHDDSFFEAWKGAVCILVAQGNANEASRRIRALSAKDQANVLARLGCAWARIVFGWEPSVMLPLLAVIERSVPAPELRGEALFLRGVIRLGSSPQGERAHAFEDFGRALAGERTPKMLRVASAQLVIALSERADLSAWALRSLAGDPSLPP